MAVPASLFFTGSLYKVGGIAFDLLLSEDHALVSSVSERAIESGAPITDHIQKQLREGNLVGMVSNYSLSQYIPEFSLLMQARLALGQSLKAKDLDGMGPPENRAMDTYQMFKALWENAEPVTISTTLETYENVVVTEISTSRDGDTGDMLQFSVKFRQVRIVTLEQVVMETSVKPTPPGKAATPKKDKAAKQASPKKDQGREVAEPVPAPWEGDSATGGFNLSTTL